MPELGPEWEETMSASAVDAACATDEPELDPEPELPVGKEVEPPVLESDAVGKGAIMTLDNEEVLGGVAADGEDGDDTGCWGAG